MHWNSSLLDWIAAGFAGEHVESLFPPLGPPLPKVDFQYSPLRVKHLLLLTSESPDSDHRLSLATRSGVLHLRPLGSDPARDFHSRRHRQLHRHPILVWLGGGGGIPERSKRVPKRLEPIEVETSAQESKTVGPF